MPLTATTEEPIERGMSAGFKLTMRDGVREVSVIVSHEALDAFAPDAPEPRQKLAERRAAIEASASAKYDRGDIAKNGHVMITPRDLETGDMPAA